MFGVTSYGVSSFGSWLGTAMVLFSAMETKSHIFRLALVCLPLTNYILSYQNTSVIRIQYVYVQRVTLSTSVYIIQNYNKPGKSNKDSFLNIVILHFYHIYIRLYISLFYIRSGLGSSRVLVLGTWCKISSTWYLLVLDTLKFKSTWYLLVLEGKVLDTCPSTFKYFCQINMYIQA